MHIVSQCFYPVFSVPLVLTYVLVHAVILIVSAEDSKITRKLKLYAALCTHFLNDLALVLMLEKWCCGTGGD